jgi:hypothetical protein
VALSGTLDTMPLPDILQFLGLSRKTGVLHLECGTVRKALHFDLGVVSYCSSGSAKEYLGQHLLARTSLREPDLEHAFATQRATGKKLGQVLVELGLLEESEIESVLKHKVEDSIYELFTWKAGRFDFEDDATPTDEIPVRLDLQWQDLVMEGARRADEMARIREVIPGGHVRFNTHPENWPEGFPRTPGDKKLLDLVAEGLTVGEICPRFHSSDFDVLTRLRAMVEEKLVDVDAISLEEGRPLTRDETLRAATLLMQRGDLVEAYQVFREGATRFYEDSAFLAGLRSCETRLRKHFVMTTHDFTVVPQLAVSLEQLSTHPLSSKEAFVASRITGSWSVRSLIQLCPFDELDVLCILDSLRRQGLVDLRIPAGV